MHLLSDLGWVVNDFSSYSTIWSVLLVLMWIGQKRLCSLAIWWNSQIKVKVSEQRNHPVSSNLPVPLCVARFFLANSQFFCFLRLVVMHRNEDITAGMLVPPRLVPPTYFGAQRLDELRFMAILMVRKTLNNPSCRVGEKFLIWGTKFLLKRNFTTKRFLKIGT